MAAISVSYEGAKNFFYQLFSRRNVIKEFPRAAGKVAIVTGGNCGIGYETARGLIRSGMTVIMGCRSEKAAESAIQHLKDEQPDARAHSSGSINFEDLQSKKSYSRFGAYAQAKVANVLFTYALQRRLSIDSTHVTANALHPGVVNTELFRHLPWIARAPMGLFFLTPEQGAATSLYACLSPDLEGVGGKYLANCEVQSSSAYSYNEDIQERLWCVSRELTGIGNE
ncbi:dehydrogenase/reductase SDR family member on chromosome X isoform X2 [Nematostella vectensis]|uniref:dehydrogenase/reductase SDR family member on chromosome X isoform X2 n=1 Tax=Nematostella vectensis TaxID=45351 RepID=UPI002076EC22|nr:dehydrogenase/reductase SDR family member on chromosome X isoform X2 [Nematostella vectensis]